MPLKNVSLRTFDASYFRKSWKSRDRTHKVDVTSSCLQRVRKALCNKGSDRDTIRLVPMPSQLQICIKKRRFVYASRKCGRSNSCTVPWAVSEGQR